MTLSEMIGHWQGQSELWTDPLGDSVQTAGCSIDVEGNSISYQWSYQGKAQLGELKLHADGAEFRDSWHQEAPIACEILSTRSLMTVRYTYMKDWGWRINLCHRTPTDELVLQMTNIAPWGEEARAVRMICKRR